MKIPGMVSVLTALTSSLCCIAPILMISGAAGLAGWLEPLRPYMVTLSVGALGWAWYRQLKPQPTTACQCDPSKVAFWQRKAFLSVLTGLTLLLLTFPAYSHWLFQDNKTSAVQPIRSEPQQIAYVSIKGMTCEGCEHHVKSEVGKLKGVTNTQVSYQQGRATVTFNPTKSSVNDIKKAVAATGYQVTAVKLNQPL